MFYLPKLIQHIVVFRLSAMGDVAMTVPVLRAFVAQNPKIKITLVSRPVYKPFFEDIENINFFEFDGKKKHKGFFGLLRLYFDLKKLKIDAFADFHDVLRSKIVRNLFALSGKKIAIIDKNRVEKKALTRSKNKIFKPLPTVFEQQQKVFERIGFKLNLSDPKFPKEAILSHSILDLIAEKDAVYKKNLIGIAPFAQHNSKVYPLDLMAKLIDTLALNNNYKILLFGGGDQEIAILNSFSKNKENVICVAGKIKFQQELQLISNLDVMISMDSGNAHIAAMLGLKVITLWGSTHPFAGFSPFHQPSQNALLSDRNLFPKLPTSIYGNKKIKGYEQVMRTISVEDICNAIENNLKK